MTTQLQCKNCGKIICEDIERGRMRKEEVQLWKSCAIAFSVCMNIVLLGSVFNYATIAENGGRMPVYGAIHDSDTHFQYEKPEQVKYPALTDIFTWTKDTKIYYCSLGDLIMLLGLGIFAFFACKTSYDYFQIRGEDGNLD